jgi:hypothetical protein
MFSAEEHGRELQLDGSVEALESRVFAGRAILDSSVDMPTQTISHSSYCSAPTYSFTQSVLVTCPKFVYTQSMTSGGNR